MIGAIDISVLLDIGSLESIDRYEQYKKITHSSISVDNFNSALIKFNFKPYSKNIVKIKKLRNDLIKEEFENGISYRAICVKYNISSARAWQIVNKDADKPIKHFGYNKIGRAHV